MGGFTNPVFGGNVLIRPAIRSPNYVPGTSGWSINRDGSAELNNLTLRGTFNGTDYIINAAGIFFYSGTPAAGNLIGSWAQTDGTDAFGNTYKAGITISGPNGSVQLSSDDGLLRSIGSSGTQVFINDGALTWQWPTEAAQAGLIIDTSKRGSMYWSTGKSAAADKSAQLSIITSNGVPTAGSQDTYPRAVTSDDVGSFIAHHYVTGAMVKATSALGTASETWQSPSYNANWGGTTSYGGLSGGLGTLRYRKDAEDNLWLLGCFTPTAGATSAVFNLPVGYRPQTANYPFPMAMVTSGGVASNAWMYVSTAGNLNINSQLGSSIVAGNSYVVNAKIPLGNIA